MREINTVAVGEILQASRTPVDIDPAADYISVGIKSFGKGLFHYPPTAGAELSKLRYFRFPTDALALSNIQAWEGAIGVTSESDAIAVASNRFLFYVPKDKNRIDVRYLRHYFLSEPGLASIREASPGSVKRNRTLSIERLQGIRIPLPSIEEQRRIVDLIGAVDEAITAADDVSRASSTLLRLRRGELLDATSVTKFAGEVFGILMGRQRSPDRAVGPNMAPYLRSANVKDGVLDLGDVKEMDFDQIERVKFHLLPGDVLVTEGSGSPTSVGAAAAWLGELTGDVCFQNTLLRYRGIDGVTNSRWVYHWCRWAYESGAFREVASGSNIKHIGYQRAVKMPVPIVDIDTQEVQSEELDILEAFSRGAVAVAQSLRHMRLSLLAGLLSGEHEIPESYDELLGE